MQIEYSLELERLLDRYKLTRNRVKAYQIEKPHLSTYDLARHFNVSQGTISNQIYFKAN